MFRLQVIGTLAFLVPFIAIVPRAAQTNEAPEPSPQDALTAPRKDRRCCAQPLASGSLYGEKRGPARTICVRFWRGRQLGTVVYGMDSRTTMGGPPFIGTFFHSASRNTRRRRWEVAFPDGLRSGATVRRPHTTDFERAWHRKTPDADFVLLLTGPEYAPGRPGPLPGMEPPPPGPSRASLALSCRVRSAHRWSLPTYAEAIRAIPCLELPPDGKHSIPSQVFKTLMRWPVRSLRTDGSTKTEICVGMPSPAVLWKHRLFPRELSQGIPAACLAAGLTREEPKRSKGGESQRFTKIEHEAPPSHNINSSSVEVDEWREGRSENVTISVETW